MPWFAELDREPPAVRGVVAVLSHLSEETLAETRTLGLRVVVWTVIEIDETPALRKLAVDGVIADFPDRAVRVPAPRRPRE